jgi:sec-independent protein translocase protein TatC
MKTVRPREAEMPFLDHLEELRWRIIWSIVAVLVGVGVGLFLVLHYDVIARLEVPILPYLHGHHVVATHPTDGLQLTMSASLWIGLVLSFPVVLYQGWLFLSPALYARERGLLVAALVGGVGLFGIGALFAYEVALPLSLPWLFNLFGTALEPMISAESYFGFVFSMVLSFGLAFELPVVVLLLSAAGLVTPQLLRRYRRHAIVLIVALGALLTPGDAVWGTLALAVPLYLLYELSILASHLVARRRSGGGGALLLLLSPLLLAHGRPRAPRLARSA